MANWLQYGPSVGNEYKLGKIKCFFLNKIVLFLTQNHNFQSTHMSSLGNLLKESLK